MIHELLQKSFKKRLVEAIQLIDSYDIVYSRRYIFGSYARGDYTGSSDIDICLIVNKKPDKHITGELREIAETMHVDIVFVTPEYFENGNDVFINNLRRDCKEV